MPPAPGKFVQVQGIQTVFRALNRFRDDCVPAVREGLLAVGHNVLELARYYCPIDTGALRASGRVEVVDTMGTGASQLRVNVLFGGKVGFTLPKPAAGGRPPQRGIPDKKYAGPEHLQGQVVYYAVFVHENLFARHDAPTCAKFLERAVREQWDTISYTLGRHLDMLIEANPKADFRAVREIGRMKIPPPAVPPAG